MDNVEKNYKIAFISDLHFDNISENTDNGISFLEAEEKKAEFIACLKRYFNDYIVCIVGDCYSNYKEMLNFIEELEQNKIYGFFVLGNHDYWSNGQKTYMEIIQFFKEKTNHFSYFRFLCTGKSYKVGELCFIGDTGWTSFKRDRKEVNKQEFNRLPENVFVKDFFCEKIIEMHNAWIEYANQMICKEKKLIILTHFPMVDFTETAYDCWWSSKTRFKIKKNYWNLFGHTHNKKQKRNNCVSSQQGYDGNNYVSYGIDDFGILCPKKLLTGTIISCKDYGLMELYKSKKILNEEISKSEVKKIKQRGYRRCRANADILDNLANNPIKYIERCKRILASYEKDTYIGYQLLNNVKLLDRIYQALFYLERCLCGAEKFDVKKFIISAVVSGYAYHDAIGYIGWMRPIDEYDIVRFYFVLLTVKKYSSDELWLGKIQRHASRYINFENVDIYLPVVDGKCLSVDEIIDCIEKDQMIEVKNGIGKTSRIQRKGNNIETIRTSSYSDSKLRTLKADIYSYLQENQGELEKLKERLTELREISEKKYMFVEKKYRKYDKANELFREEDS